MQLDSQDTAVAALQLIISLYVNLVHAEFPILNVKFMGSLKVQSFLVLAVSLTGESDHNAVAVGVVHYNDVRCELHHVEVRRATDS